jgi:hypothetical protein
MKSAPTIVFDYRPSRMIGAAATLVSACAVLAPWASALPGVLRAALSLGALGWAATVLHGYRNSSFKRIALRASGWALVDAANEEHAAILESHARVGMLIAMGFRHGPRARFRVVLGPDNLDADTRRRLILLLSRAEIVHAA